jgi:hypothetical protein
MALKGEHSFCFIGYTEIAHFFGVHESVISCESWFTPAFMDPWKTIPHLLSRKRKTRRDESVK